MHKKKHPAGSAGYWVGTIFGFPSVCKKVIRCVLFIHEISYSHRIKLIEINESFVAESYVKLLEAFFNQRLGR
jgi:hypothetical protein